MPKSVFDAATDVMAAISAPISFNDLAYETEQHLNQHLPAYLCRTVLRFWLSIDPPVVRKVRTRYEPVSRGRLRAHVQKEVWPRTGCDGHANFGI
ncbi:MAG: hypothetical protein CMJ49_12295 [Planctomycetaceae bacterium]|nr:hypothetical protein [Planctomycetaceae bacterium]